MSDDNEQWLPVVGSESYYEVSNLGRIRSRKRQVWKGCVGTVTLESKILEQCTGGRANNYKRVMLCAGHSKVHAYVHTLVAAAFLGPRPPDMVTCHHNDDGFDNRSANLYYGDRADNEADRYRNREPVPYRLDEERERIADAVGF